MIRMPKAERLMHVAQGLNALTEVLISDLILEDSSQAPGAIRNGHLEGYLRAMQCLGLELEDAVTDAWENADNPTYICEADHKRAKEEALEISATVSVLTWGHEPVTRRTVQEPGQ
ncbi:hypothetical protein HKK55_15750 [Pseudomonas sp. ADAK18]|uniref:hypothetical protein n=1 Tax=Pseudomonas sp. ADAK18 TaxID=2730848 RepID=UPI001462B654|nr:hypothetical protein [Pseudomonas sp. ADAK18]QJI30092.1 hypothetical protein HKK55_15750 [Pseudomonas sp. ADAK18]